MKLFKPIICHFPIFLYAHSHVFVPVYGAECIQSRLCVVRHLLCCLCC